MNKRQRKKHNIGYLEVNIQFKADESLVDKDGIPNVGGLIEEGLDRYALFLTGYCGRFSSDLTCSVGLVAESLYNALDISNNFYAMLHWLEYNGLEFTGLKGAIHYVNPRTYKKVQLAKRAADAVRELKERGQIPE